MSDAGDNRLSDVEVGMAAAIDAARRGLELGEAPIGAATVRAGTVISARHAEEIHQRRRLVHADLLALEDADRLHPSVDDRADMTLVVTLEPCLLCMGAAMVFGVGRVHFGLESPTDGAAEAAEGWGRRIASLDGFALPEIGAGCRREECLELMRDFVSTRSAGGIWRWARATLASIEAQTSG